MMMIKQADIDKSMDYSHYRNLVDDLLSQGLSTGENQSESMTHYSRMNVHRMEKWDKIGKLNLNLIDRLNTLTMPQTWLVLTEGWCGDAAQNLPFIAKMVTHAPEIRLRFLLRDQNIHIMDKYLTNGGRSIPKLIALDSEMNELFNWGPRPKYAQDFVMQKRSDGVPYKVYSEELHKWYARDKGNALQREFLALLGEPVSS